MPKRLVSPELMSRLRSMLTAQRDVTDVPMDAAPPPKRSPVERAVDIIAQHEGFREKAYRDPTGRMTIGYGQATPDIRPGMRTTEPEARAFLEERVRADSANFARRGIPVSAGLLSAAYNLGRGNLGEYGVLSALRSGDYEQAAKILETATRAGGRVLPGLVTRRKQEAEDIRKSAPIPFTLPGSR